MANMNPECGLQTILALRKRSSVEAGGLRAFRNPAAPAASWVNQHVAQSTQFKVCRAPVVVRASLGHVRHELAPRARLQLWRQRQGRDEEGRG